MFEPIVKAETRYITTGRNLIIRVSKVDKTKEIDDWWPRVTKEKVKNQFITFDWDKWIDPDASDDDKKNNNDLMAEWDESLFQPVGTGMGGGMGGGGGMPDLGSMMKGMGKDAGGLGDLPPMDENEMKRLVEQAQKE